MEKQLLIAIALGVALLQPQSSAAQSGELAPFRATIVKIDGDDVYLDASRAALQNASRLIVYRRVVVRHPITHKALEDRFPIGELQLVQAGESLSLARAAAPQAQRFAIGDRVDVAAPPDPPTKPASHALENIPADREPSLARASPASATANATVQVGVTPDPETAELARQFEAMLGQPPGQRIRLYRRYLARFPQSRYRSIIEQELSWLGVWRQASADYARDRVALDRTTRLQRAVEVLPPARATAHEPVALAVRVRPEAGVRGLALNVRATSNDLYQTFPMALDAEGHAQARIPGELVRPPGFAFFIEAVGDHGESAAAFGDARSPKTVNVAAEAVAPGQARREPVLRVRFSSELASFEDTSGRDYFLINEGDFLYRLRRGPLYGVRMGYGRFDGQGGTVQELDVLGHEPRRAGFTYAYFETEFTLSRLVGLAMRGTVGLGRPADPGAQNKISGGFQSRLRLGDPDRTHLVIAGELLPEIGQRALLQFGWELIDRVPMAAEVQVTDQPVNSDELAVRIVYELGYRFSERIAIALRPSYQLRTIRHAGPGLGLSATFDW